MNAPVVLCVAQRPKTALLIAQTLSGQQSPNQVSFNLIHLLKAKSKGKCSQVFEFTKSCEGKLKSYLVTAVNDHEITRIWFPDQCRQWQGARLIELYDVHLDKQIHES